MDQGPWPRLEQQLHPYRHLPEPQEDLMTTITRPANSEPAGRLRRMQ